MRGWSPATTRKVSPRSARARREDGGFDHQHEHHSQWAAICSIADKFGMTHETLRRWVRQAETDEGLRPGLTTDERERLKVLERENFELRLANEILKPASASFAAELDRRPTR